MSTLMKAAVFYGVRDVRIEDVPKPTAGPGKLSCGFSAVPCAGPTSASSPTGRRTWCRRPSPATKLWEPFTKLGSGVNNGLRMGQKAVVATVVGCGKCIYCQRKQYNLCDSFTAIGYDYAGGFAEYVKIPAAAVAPRQRHSHSRLHVRRPRRTD